MKNREDEGSDEVIKQYKAEILAEYIQGIEEVTERENAITRASIFTDEDYNRIYAYRR